MYRKYKNKKTIVDGIKFDSKKEAERYQELKLLEKSGYIENLELQPKFELIDTIKYQGETLRKLSYIADFKYVDLTGTTIIEDTKGFKTDVYQIKKRLFLQKYVIGKDNIQFNEN